MKYINLETRNEIASVLAEDHDCWVRYRDKQPQHLAKGINIRHSVAEAHIKRYRKLIAILAPEMLKPRKSDSPHAQHAPSPSRKIRRPRR